VSADSKTRQRLLATGGQQGAFDANTAFKRATSGANIANMLRRVSSLGDRDADFLGGKELLMPFELAEEVRLLVHEMQGFEGQAAEAGNRHGAKSDAATLLRLELDCEGPQYEDALVEETAVLRKEEARRLALLDKAVKMVDVSLGAHMVARQKMLQDERKSVVSDYQTRVDAAQRDVAGWYVCVCTYVCVYGYTYACIYTYACTHAYIFIHTYIHTHTCVNAADWYVCVFVVFMYTRTNTHDHQYSYVHAYPHTWRSALLLTGMCACIYTQSFAFVSYVYTHTHAPLHAIAHAHTQMHTHVCTNALSRTHTRTQTPSRIFKYREKSKYHPTHRRKSQHSKIRAALCFPLFFSRI